MRRINLPAIMTAAVLGGCAGPVGYSATVSSGGYAYGPDLVYVAPGVQVIADYNEPIFYSDSFYWRFYGGTWYRSHYYDRGWVYAVPPAPLLRIGRPHDYVHYRPQGWVARRDRGPIVRDHRDDRITPRPGRRPPPAAAPPAKRHAPPPSRGHRDDRDHRG